MEQRAREMGKTAEAAVYRKYIEKMKKKTKDMRKENIIQTAKKRLKQEKIDRRRFIQKSRMLFSFLSAMADINSYPFSFGWTPSGVYSFLRPLLSSTISEK